MYLLFFYFRKLCVTWYLQYNEIFFFSKHAFRGMHLVQQFRSHLGWQHLPLRCSDLIRGSSSWFRLLINCRPWKPVNGGSTNWIKATISEMYMDFPVSRFCLVRLWSLRVFGIWQVNQRLGFQERCLFSSVFVCLKTMSWIWWWWWWWWW